jgi:hypothetical protein
MENLQSTYGQLQQVIIDAKSYARNSAKETGSLSVRWDALLSPENYKMVELFNAYLFGQNANHKIQLTIGSIATNSFSQFINLR